MIIISLKEPCGGDWKCNDYVIVTVVVVLVIDVVSLPFVCDMAVTSNGGVRL